MVTIKEIAAEAGVSVMTVSNVVHNNLSKVSPATVERVRKIIDKYHYVPNMAARSLITNASHIIAVLLPLWHQSAASLLFDPYSGYMTGMLEMLLRERGYYAMLCSFHDAEQVLTMQRNWRVDGSILVLPHEDEITHALVRHSASPLVVLDRRFEDLPMLSVTVDDRKGGYISTKHLLERGHRRIGFACPSVEDSSVIRDRYAGYLDALHEHGVTENPAWMFNNFYGRHGGEKIGRAVAQMQDRPSAIVSTEDSLACGIIKACQAEGMQVPRDLSVTGFDDSQAARLVTPELTTVRQDVLLKAQHAVDILVEAIGDAQVRDRSAVIDVELVERASVASV